MMKLIDITNTNRPFVQKQLDNTDATFIKLFSYGPTTICYTKAPKHIEVLYQNKKRNIKDSEINDTLPVLLQNENLNIDDLDSIRLNGYVEFSIPKNSIA